MKKILHALFAGLIAVLTLFPAIPSAAMTLQSGEEFILPENQVVNDDLYVGAGNSTINGSVNGDLYIAGGNIAVSNRVDQDLVAVGGSITVNADVGDDLRIAGGDITILKSVGDDVIAGGGTVHILKDAVINGDLTVGGGLVTIDGTVKGSVRIAAGTVAINGTVEGPIVVTADKALTIGAGATVMGQVMYTGNSEAQVSDMATLSKGVEFKQLERKSIHANKEKAEVFGGVLAGLFGGMFLLQALMYIVTALLLVIFLKAFSKKLIDTSMKNVGTNMLRGFAFMILTPIALIFIAMTIVGLPIAIIAGIAYALCIAIAKIYTGILLGAWIFKLASKKQVELDWKVALVGVAAMEILVLIPFIGWLAVALVFLTVLGAVYQGVQKRLKEAR